MPQGAVPRRYAEAAFGLARKDNKLDRWRTDLRAAASALSEPRLLALLDDPSPSAEEKRKMVDQVLPKEIDPDVRRLIYLLTERGRIRKLDQVVVEFLEMANREQGVVIARVVTAVPLSEKGQQDVAERLRRLVGARKLEIQPTVDKSILGGIIAQIGDELYDGSVRTRLAQLGQRIG